MKRNIEKRLEQLEKVFLPPKPKSTRPMILFHRPYHGSGMTVKDFKASLKALSAHGLPIMIMSRPGDMQGPGSTRPVEEVRGKADAGTKPAFSAKEPEPDDADLEGAIADLERRLKDGGGRT